MPYKISGFISHNHTCRVIVIDKNDYTIEDNTVFSGTSGASGYRDYELTGLTNTEKLVLGRRVRDGWVQGHTINPTEYIIPNPLWTWGYNIQGQLGLEDVIPRSSPVQVGFDRSSSELAGGECHTMVVTSDGELWAWGYNGSGQLGNGETDPFRRSSPVQIGSDTNWLDVACGNDFTVGIKTDGTIWAWGDNTYGQLGLEDVTHRSSPVQVGSETYWQSLALGPGFTYALTNVNLLYGWGQNYLGQLGQNNITGYSSPVLVGNNYSKIAAGARYGMFIKTNGQLWAVGGNGGGCLGLGDEIHRSSPVQVGSDTNWNYISCAVAASFGTKTNGTLWSWGGAGFGILGQGDLTRRSSPTQVGALTDWLAPIANSGGVSVYAIKTDSTLWGWGWNNQGELGIGDTNHRSSPVQVGALTDWVVGQTVAGENHMLAYK